MSWIKGFATAPEGYVCREFRKEDGILEGVEIEHPIIGGTMEKDGVPIAYAGINQIAGRHWVFMYIKDEWEVSHSGKKRPWMVVHLDGKKHASVTGAPRYYSHYSSALAAANRINLGCSVRRHGLWIARLMFDSLKMFEKAGITELYGLCDNTKPHATQFLSKLGFRPMSVYDKPIEVMVYEKLMGGQAKTWIRRTGDK